MLFIHAHSYNSLHSSSDGNAPYEDFHEKYISYKHEPFRNRSVSFEEPTEIISKKDDVHELRYDFRLQNHIGFCNKSALHVCYTLF